MYVSIKIKIHTILGNKIKENRDWRTAKPLHDYGEFISVGKLSDDEIITIAMSQLVEISNFVIDDIDKVKDAVSYVTNTDWYGFMCRTNNGVNMVVLPESYYLEELPF